MADGAALQTTKTTCPYCGVGCGVAARADGARTVLVEGDSRHPANFGRLCSKGSALGATTSLDGRLLHPEINGRQASWETAIAHVARGFSETIAKHGPDSVAFYVSGQLLTEDYYAANKLMKGFIGSANIDTNSRLCMASAVSAHKQAFGADLVPGCYEDLELADLVVFSGHNAAWTHPVLFRRMEKARDERGQMWITIDPRRTDTAEASDLHLALKPQTDVRLWNGLVAWLHDRGAIDRKFIAAHTQGWTETITRLARDDQSSAAIAQDCDLSSLDVETFYHRFAETPRTVSLFSMGANQSAQGVAKGLAIINAHLASGKIGKPGAAPFSITGQPNAMGGRETGGMANMLAAHMDFDSEHRDRVARFWNAPRLARGPGLKAIDMFRAVERGEIKAIWIMATNPVVSLPDAERVRAGLAACPLVVVSDVMADTDTLAHAHVKLPALAWGEKDGTVTNSERRISRQRPIFAAPGEARADWAIVADVADAMGFGDDFAWTGAGDVFREYAALTNFENDGSRFLNLGPLSALSEAAYDQLQPVQWPVHPDGSGTRRLFTNNQFQTETKRAQFVSVAPKPPAYATSPEFPLTLNTGRVRDHWHTMTRTALAPQLCRHAPEPRIEAHPRDAERAGLKDGALARIATTFGEAVAPIAITDRQREGDLFLPMHWPALYASKGRANPLVNPAVDPQSGQPEFKHTPARLEAYNETWRGFLIDRTHRAQPEGVDLVWRRIPQEHCQLYEFAGRGGADERASVIEALGAAGHAISMVDEATSAMRRAVVRNDRLEQVLFITTQQGRLPSRAWLIERFGDETIDNAVRAALLAGRQPGAIDHGPVICACGNVGQKKIEAAIAGGACTLDTLGAATGAGVTCGSCRIDLTKMLSTALAQE